MSLTREIVNVFLASPGDLDMERELVREAVREVNSLWANKLGFHVELYGWEETISTFGRPQKTINSELDKCDLFIGLMWRRWGSPPDSEGEFTSGFEEEYTRALARRESTGKPGISLFFKKIPTDFLRDPGDGLKRVLNFRDSIVAQKKILYNQFSDPVEIEKLARRCVTEFISQLRDERESSSEDLDKPKSGSERGSQTETAGQEKNGSLVSERGLTFLETFVKKLKDPESASELNGFEVARFRLLSNAISREGNHEEFLGAHDANLLYQGAFDKACFGEAEIRALTRLGFRALKQENMPFWKWYSQLRVISDQDPAIASSAIGSTASEKINAIYVMHILRIPFPDHKSLFDSDLIKKLWFSDPSSSGVRLAALRYLSSVGSEEDIEIAEQEYRRSDGLTSNEALECVIELLIRSCKLKEACQRLLDSQFVSLRKDLVDEALSELDRFDRQVIISACDHSSPQVRAAAIRSLTKMEYFECDVAGRLQDDSSAEVRLNSLLHIKKSGSAVSEEKAQKILHGNRAEFLGPTYGLISRQGQLSGISAWEEYKSILLRDLSDGELATKVEKASIFELEPYFEYLRRDVPGSLEQLRLDVDDRFENFFNIRLEKMSESLGGGLRGADLISKTKDLETHIRKDATRMGLAILARASKPCDLERVRINLQDDYCGATIDDVKFLKRHGGWQDIAILAQSKQSSVFVSNYKNVSEDEFRSVVAEAMIALAKSKEISDLFRVDLPDPTLKLVIKEIAFSRFAEIPEDVVLQLLYNNSEEVRKNAALMVVRSFSMSKTRKLLLSYIEGDQYRFYNVIHWLDLGISMSRKEARTAADFVLENGHGK